VRDPPPREWCRAPAPISRSFTVWTPTLDVVLGRKQCVRAALPRPGPGVRLDHVGVRESSEISFSRMPCVRGGLGWRGGRSRRGGLGPSSGAPAPEVAGSARPWLAPGRPRRRQRRGLICEAASFLPGPERRLPVDRLASDHAGFAGPPPSGRRSWVSQLIGFTAGPFSPTFAPPRRGRLGSHLGRIRPPRCWPWPLSGLLHRDDPSPSGVSVRFGNRCPLGSSPPYAGDALPNWLPLTSLRGPLLTSRATWPNRILRAS